MRRLLPSLLLSVLFLLPLEGMVTVRLRSAVLLGSRVVRLGDIARIQGGDGTLRTLTVARLADGEREKVLAYDRIKSAIDASGREGVVLIGGDIMLRLRMVGVSRKRCLSLVRGALDGLAGSRHFTLHMESELPSFVAGVRSLALEGAPVISGRNWHARFRAVDGENRTRVFSCRGRIARQVMLPVAVRALAKGTRITSADITGQPFPEGTAGISVAAGRVLARNVEKGARIRKSDLREIEPFRAGSRVRVMWQAPGIRIVFYGRALEPGKPGDRIRFRNELTGRVLYGRVARGRLVRMEEGDMHE